MRQRPTASPRRPQHVHPLLLEPSPLLTHGHLIPLSSFSYSLLWREADGGHLRECFLRGLSITSNGSSSAHTSSSTSQIVGSSAGWWAAAGAASIVLMPLPYHSLPLFG